MAKKASSLKPISEKQAESKAYRLDVSFDVAISKGLVPEFGRTGLFVGFKGVDGATYRPILAFEKETPSSEKYADISASAMNRAGIEELDLHSKSIEEIG